MSSTATPPRPRSTWATDADRPESMVEQLRSLVGRNALRWKFLGVLEAAGLAVAIPLGYLWTAFLLDNALHLPVWGRLLAVAGFVAAVVLPGIRLVRKLKALTLTEDEVALAIERQTRGGVQNRLINALQLSRGAEGEANLTQAVVRENYDSLRKTDLPAAVPGRPAYLRVGIALGLIAVGVGFWLLRPDHFANAAGRLFQPLARIEPLYRTRLEVTIGDVVAGSDVAIRIRIKGERPEKLTVLRTVQQQRFQDALEVPTGADAVDHVFTGVKQSLTFQVMGGDYRTQIFRIEVPARVRLSLVRATYHPPAYTGRQATASDRAGGDLEALRGTRADLTFVLDQPVAEATLLVERGEGKQVAVSKVALTHQSGGEYRCELALDESGGYELMVKQDGQEPELLGPFAIRVLADQEPKLELTGLAELAELPADAIVSLGLRATDDLGLEKVGLFWRKAGESGWKEIASWPANRATELTRRHELALASLGMAEGDALELAVRAIDTDPLKKGEWVTGMPRKLLVGGDGVALQRLYEQILRSEAAIKGMTAVQNTAAEKTIAEMKKLEAASGINWADAKNVQAHSAAVAALAKGQEALRQTASQVARDMPAPSGTLRISVGMLADTEMIRAIRILESVASREGPEAKRVALADARLTQERTGRSLAEIGEQYAAFRQEWELSHMIAFVEMLAERQGKLRDDSTRHATTAPPEAVRGSMKTRQLKVLELVKLARPAFEGMSERVRTVEAVLADAFATAAKDLAAAPMHALMTQAADVALAGDWAGAVSKQDQAAKELASVFARLKKAQADAALKALEALKQKAKSDAEAQKELEKLKAGTSEAFIAAKDKLKLEDIIHLREVAGKKYGKTKNSDADEYLLPDSAKAALNPADTGKRQDFNILKLASSPRGTPSFPKQSDREGNKIGNPPIQEKFDDLVGKLLEEADEIQKKYETYNLNTSFNINEPGEVGKQGGDLNSTAASAATGNMKPPTSNVGGASRAGRRGARAHGNVVGSESINRRGRDKVQEGQEKTADQAGTIREKKSEDWQKDTSTGTGGKKVEGDDEVKFSLEDAGKWSDDIAKKLGKPQAKNFIVERMDGRLDAKVAEMLRDLTNRQEQIIERVKSIRKELRNLYLPTDHLDEVLAKLAANLEALKEQPDADLFRLQAQALEQLRNTVRVFQTPASGFQPSLPRERMLHGRVLDEPARAALPGYEEAVKRYYEKLSGR